MPLFGRRKSDTWHETVNSTVLGHLAPVSADLVCNADFPWTQLRLTTDKHLKAQGKLQPQQRDMLLTGLIMNYPSMSVALAASAHAMSPQAVRDLLHREFSVQPGNDSGMALFLQVLLIVNRVNPIAIHEVEVQWARNLLPFSATSSHVAGPQLEAIFTLLGAGVPTIAHALLHSYTYAVGQRMCTNFGLQLDMLKEKGLWLPAHFAAAPLFRLPGWFLEQYPGNTTPQQLLDIVYPPWRAWSMWQPNIQRLALRGQRLSTEQCEILKEILALEGPDFISNQQHTLSEGLIPKTGSASPLIIRSGNLSVVVRSSSVSEVRETLNRLQTAVDTACSNGQHDIALLMHFCVGKPVDDEALHILEGVSRMANIAISTAVLDLYMAQNEPGVIQMGRMMRLLPTLSRVRGQTLRQALAPRLLNHISDCIQGVQDKLRNQLAAGKPWHISEMRSLQVIGKYLQDTEWLQLLLDGPLLDLIRRWPTLEKLECLYAVRVAAQSTRPGITTSLARKIDAYCIDCLIKYGTVDESTRSSITCLTYLWQQVSDVERRAVALMMVQDSVVDSAFGRSCIEQLPFLPDDFVKSLMKILDSHGEHPDTTCLELTRLLAATPSSAAVLGCWRPILQHLIVKRKSTIFEYTTTHLKMEAWMTWLAELRYIFDDMWAWPQASIPVVFQKNLHKWVQRLAAHLPIITRLESITNFQPLKKCLFLGFEKPLADNFLDILHILEEGYIGYHQAAMEAVLGLLIVDGSNAREIRELLSLLCKTTRNGVDACLHILEMYAQTTSVVVETILASWLHASGMQRVDHIALIGVAMVLGIDVGILSSPPAASLEAAACYLDSEVAELLAEARRLDNLRQVLKSNDSDEISGLLASLQIENPSPADDAISNLPAALVDVVEKVGEQEFELHFPLMHLTALQRTGMGVGDAQVILVRFVLGNPTSPHGSPHSFCVHLENEMNGQDAINGHFPWAVFDSTRLPSKDSCFGHANRAKYQIARILARHLQKGFLSLENMHSLLTSTINDMAQNCLVCGAVQPSRMRRSTTCQASSCSKALEHASLDVRLANIRQDPDVLDVLLTSIYAVTLSGKLDLLLQGCPVNTASTLQKLLDSFPPMNQLQNASDLDTSIKRLGKQSEALLTWVCSTYRGFLVSASGQLRIPGMPGVHQFVLANAAPELESAWLARLGQQSTRVLFHGTSLDRLHAILCQGLRVCSGTNLMSHGAVLGNGIYTAEEPRTAWGYSTAGTSWKGSAFPNVQVVLGCELAGISTPARTGIHVIKDPSTLMVRYVFLVPPTAAAPLAAHIVPAMQSVFASLRSGAL